MTDPASTSPDATIVRDLLEHSEWVRRLARELVQDPHVADDLAQETLMAAVESPPRRLSNPRAWLATVLRNRATSRYRGEARPAGRAPAAPPPGGPPAPPNPGWY
jgi:DNA-directed RNA polymerase specialized sigma24 family protein